MKTNALGKSLIICIVSIHVEKITEAIITGFLNKLRVNVGNETRSGATLIPISMVSELLPLLFGYTVSAFHCKWYVHISTPAGYRCCNIYGKRCLYKLIATNKKDPTTQTFCGVITSSD